MGTRSFQLAVMLSMWSAVSLATRPALAEAHKLTVTINDLSGAASPIRASGQVSFQEELSANSVETRWSMDVRLTNASNKTIVAYEVSIEATPDHGGGGFSHISQVDHFFRPNLEFVPGAQEEDSLSNPGLHVSPRNPSAPLGNDSATFKVLFVQFADGSKFGTSKWAATLSEARQRSVQRMQEISSAYAASGEGALRTSVVASLNNPDELRVTRAVMTHIKGTLDSSGPSAAAAEIKQFLAVAEARKDIM